MHAIQALGAYVPEDRRLALSGGEALPDRAEGSALFADVSGFTALTAMLTSMAGPRRGSEETSHHMNTVYDAIISAVHANRGSVLSFAGDAITCWFDGDDGRRAVECAMSMQAAMKRFEDLPVVVSGSATDPDAEAHHVTLCVKVCIATGPVRRYLVGDPSVQQLDVLAGDTLIRLASLDAYASRGEVVVDDATILALEDRPELGVHTLAAGAHLVSKRPATQEPAERDRAEPGPVMPGERPPAGIGTSASDQEAGLDGEPWGWRGGEAQAVAALEPWLLPTVFRRLMAGRGEFLTELRPVAALFLRFGGIDHDDDPEAGAKLDAFVRWVQDETTRAGGALIQLTIGDKGSYLYLAFGAPVSHEDDPERCGSVALRLQRLPPELRYIELLGIGLGYGVMRTGAYGTASRRTYGALGNETNLAARLMVAARNGAIIASEAFHRAALESFVWEDLPEAKVKGREETMVVFALRAARRNPTQEMVIDRAAVPMVGRRAELAAIEARLDRARKGQGHVVAVTAEAGMGKSRLIAQSLQAARSAGATILGGTCQAVDTRSPYRVWQPVLQELLGIDPLASLAEQEAAARAAVHAIDPALDARFPLLGPVLDLSLPETDLTRSLEPELRLSSRESLLVRVIRWNARRVGDGGSALVIVLEDLHWIDPLSRELLAAVARVAPELPLLVLASRRPADPQQPEAISAWGEGTVQEIHLTRLTSREARRLLDVRLEAAREREAPAVRLAPDVVRELIQRTEGNPYYLEVLVADLLERVPAGGSVDSLAEAAWPTSIHGLILSRIDRLSEEQQAALKVASVIGRNFPFAWLHGCMPVRNPDALRADLDAMAKLDLTHVDIVEPLTYTFKHAITRDVSYESLPFGLRTGLHERIAAFLEQHVAGSGEHHLGLLAFHYEHSDNLDKKRVYLERAAEAARRAFANEAALDYYDRLLKVIERGRRPEALRWVGEVAALSGRYAKAEASYREGLEALEGTPDARLHARFRRLLGELFERQGSHAEAMAWLEQAADLCRANRDEAELAAVLLALGGNVLWHQGAFEPARQQLEEALALGDRLADRQVTARALHGLGNIDLHQGRLAEARERFERSLDMRRELGDEQGMANALNNLGIIAANQGDAAEATRLFRDSLAVRERMGDTSGVAIAFNNLGFMASQAGDEKEATRLYERSLRLRRELGDRLGMAVSMNNIADLARARSDDARAAELYRQSLTLTHEIGNRREAAAALMGLAALAGRSQVEGVALRLATAAEALLEGIGASMDDEVKRSFETVRSAAEAALPASELEEAERAGRGMSFTEAVNFALRPPVPSSRSRPPTNARSDGGAVGAVGAVGE